MADEGYVSVVARAPSAALAERAAAEAFAAGAAGLEERDEGRCLVLYAPSGRAAAVCTALRSLAREGLAVESPEPVAPVDWRSAWRQGLEPIEISPRLVVRPSFAPATARAGQVELVVDPGQAFGTGAHASTRLALELLDALEETLLRDGRVLDAGCGTGVLALAAVRLGAQRAVAFDLDPLAVEATRDNARANGLEGRVVAFAGPLDALVPAMRFEVVLANMIRSELEPLLPGLAARLAVGGSLLLSGLLAGEEGRIGAALGAQGLRIAATRRATDASGDAWLALHARR